MPSPFFLSQASLMGHPAHGPPLGRLSALYAERPAYAAARASMMMTVASCMGWGIAFFHWWPA